MPYIHIACTVHSTWNGLQSSNLTREKLCVWPAKWNWICTVKNPDVLLWYTVNPAAVWTGYPHWLWWVLSARHLLCGNKLPGRRWSIESDVCVAFIPPVQTTTVHHFQTLAEAPQRMLVVCRTNYGRISHTSNQRTWRARANKPLCPLPHLKSKWGVQKWGQGSLELPNVVQTKVQKWCWETLKVQLH